jgi:branched-chain amino acid transport system permease protein
MSSRFRNIGFAAGWSGFLVLPFMGWRGAMELAGLLAVGGGLLEVSRKLARSSFFRAWVDSFQIQSRLLAGRLSNPALQRVYWGGGLCLLVLLPLGMNNYYVDILTLTGIYIVLALGLNIVVGLAGLLDLGYVAFYAIGAYTYALVSTQWGVPFWLALFLGSVLSALLGTSLGMITLRLRGDYLAIVTLGFLMIVHLVLNNWDKVTRGPNGILGIPSPSLWGWSFSKPIHFFYLILLIGLLVVFSVKRLNHSRIGRAWIAIREDEMAAEAMGIPVTSLKVLAFAFGAGIAGMAGVFFAGRYGFVSPESFTFFETVFILAMVVLGGMGSTAGVVLGALLLVMLPELFRGLEDYRMLVFGGVMVVVMAFRPQGLIGNPRSTIKLRKGEV